jgi:acetylornithine deacetylase/succinyl-diaminopimelate desuccinylase-like protein
VSRVAGQADSVTDILGALEVLTAAPTPRGAERDTALALAAWASDRWPQLIFEVEPVGASGANLFAHKGSTASGDLLIYSHLDTSLTGDGVRDAPVTGRVDRPAHGIAVAEGRVAGFGLGVARGPAAAALAGFADAATTPGTGGLRLLLAGGGTHENALGTIIETPVQTETGLESHLRTHPQPSAAIVAKAGPEGVLWDEPGAVYVRVRIRTARGAVLARDKAVPAGGLPAHLGVLISAIERWRSLIVEDLGTPGQSGREAGIGAVQCGSPRKPDLLPAVADVFVYLVTRPDDNYDDLVARLDEHLRSDLAAGPLAACDIEITHSDAPGAGRTPRTDPFVATAIALWEERHRRPVPDITGWTGSTDGSLLRARGVATIRTGPTSVIEDERPEWDSIDIAELAECAELYAAIACRW